MNDKKNLSIYLTSYYLSKLTKKESINTLNESKPMKSQEKIRNTKYSNNLYLKRVKNRVSSEISIENLLNNKNKSLTEVEKIIENENFNLLNKTNEQENIINYKKSKFNNLEIMIQKEINSLKIEDHSMQVNYENKINNLNAEISKKSGEYENLLFIEVEERKKRDSLISSISAIKDNNEDLSQNFIKNLKSEKFQVIENKKLNLSKINSGYLQIEKFHQKKISEHFQIYQNLKLEFDNFLINQKNLEDLINELNKEKGIKINLLDELKKKEEQLREGVIKLLDNVNHKVRKMRRLFLKNIEKKYMKLDDEDKLLLIIKKRIEKGINYEGNRSLISMKNKEIMEMNLSLEKLKKQRDFLKHKKSKFILNSDVENPENSENLIDFHDLLRNINLEKEKLLLKIKKVDEYFLNFLFFLDRVSRKHDKVILIDSANLQKAFMNLKNNNSISQKDDFINFFNHLKKFCMNFQLYIIKQELRIVEYFFQAKNDGFEIIDISVLSHLLSKSKLRKSKNYDIRINLNKSEKSLIYNDFRRKAVIFQNEKKFGSELESKILKYDELSEKYNKGEILSPKKYKFRSNEKIKNNLVNNNNMKLKTLKLLNLSESYFEKTHKIDNVLLDMKDKMMLNLKSLQAKKTILNKQRSLSTNTIPINLENQFKEKLSQKKLQTINYKFNLTKNQLSLKKNASSILKNTQFNIDKNDFLADLFSDEYLNENDNEIKRLKFNKSLQSINSHSTTIMSNRIKNNIIL